MEQHGVEDRQPANANGMMKSCCLTIRFFHVRTVAAAVVGREHIYPLKKIPVCCWASICSRRRRRRRLTTAPTTTFPSLFRQKRMSTRLWTLESNSRVMDWRPKVTARRWDPSILGTVSIPHQRQRAHQKLALLVLEHLHTHQDGRALFSFYFFFFFLPLSSGGSLSFSLFPSFLFNRDRYLWRRKKKK